MEELKKGYKKTKIGVIPKDWEVKKLGEVGKIVGGGTPSTSKSEYWGNDIFWFTPTEIKNKYLYTSNRKITLLGLKKSSAKLLPKNTILLTTRATIGDVAIVKNECCTNQGFQSIIVNKKNDFEYIYYWIINNKKEFLKRASGSTFIEISKKEIEKIEIPLPPLKEQEKIAKILSTWDRAIEIQEELIKEKEKLKTALMQKLLSGKVRFKEFSEKWEEVRLGDIAKITTGTSKSKYKERNGKYYIIDMGAISKDGFLIPIKKTNCKDDFLDYGDLVMPKDDIGGGQIIGKVAFINKNNKYILGDHVFKLKIIKKANSLFIFYLINSFIINKKLKRKVTGSVQLGLNKKSVETLEFILPPLKEQQKIAKVLSTADREIELLKEELEEFKKQKKALMQKLLTGKVRVKI